MKKASLTEKIINDYADVIKWGAGQVVDTYQEIDLYLFRGRNLDEKRRTCSLSWICWTTTSRSSARCRQMSARRLLLKKFFREPHSRDFSRE